MGYLNKNGELLTYIKKHQQLSEEELVIKLLREFDDYGLGDTQYLEIIRDSRNNKIEL